MQSTSLLRLISSTSAADLILDGTPRSGPNARLTSDYKQIRFRAHLAAVVAAWEAYIEAVVEEFLTVLGRHARRPLESTLYTLLMEESKRCRKKFNTPNWDNCRSHVSNFTGFDIFSVWTWPAGGLGIPVAAKGRLDEILQVRHSFAHGFPLPAYSWLENRNGSRYLSAAVCRKVESFLRHLANETDRGLEMQLRQILGATASW